MRGEDRGELEEEWERMGEAGGRARGDGQASERGMGEEGEEGEAQSMGSELWAMGEGAVGEGEGDTEGKEEGMSWTKLLGNTPLRPSVVSPTHHPSSHWESTTNTSPFTRLSSSDERGS